MSKHARRPNTLKVKAFRYRESGGVQFSVYADWGDKHVGKYSFGVQLFLWGFQVDFFLHGEPVYRCSGCESEEEAAENWLLSAPSGQSRALLLCPKCQ